MSKVWRVTLVAGVLLVALLALSLGAVLVWVLPEHIGRVVIDGHALELKQAHAGHWLLASLGVLIAMVVVAVVAVIATVVPIIGAGIGLLLMIGVVAIAFSPVILIGWWMWKRSKARADNAAEAATMPP